MEGTILDFIKLASENEELGREIGKLAAKHDFEFSPRDELSEEELEGVTGGLSFSYIPRIITWMPPPPPSGDLGEDPYANDPRPPSNPFGDKNKPPGG